MVELAPVICCADVFGPPRGVVAGLESGYANDGRNYGVSKSMNGCLGIQDFLRHCLNDIYNLEDKEGDVRGEFCEPGDTRLGREDQLLGSHIVLRTMINVCSKI
ncbi:hypothetical protein Salat_1885700 [Sesamum alatum]|uniref:Uncharacterized protein n=1 Tax=Sesamum alatum TaxID=300844 RepID=A0AAE1Y4H3_9LAMI|nr:hypothetical protein Salat_1885700 [Sesamum alatum]